MQEGWTTEEGIEVLDGWSFQVSPDVVLAISDVVD